MNSKLCDTKNHAISPGSASSPSFLNKALEEYAMFFHPQIDNNTFVPQEKNIRSQLEDNPYSKRQLITLDPRLPAVWGRA
jgi:hypothetical protein